MPKFRPLEEPVFYDHLNSNISTFIDRHSFEFQGFNILNAGHHHSFTVQGSQVLSSWRWLFLVQSHSFERPLQPQGLYSDFEYYDLSMPCISSSLDTLALKFQGSRKVELSQLLRFSKIGRGLSPGTAERILGDSIACRSGLQDSSLGHPRLRPRIRYGEPEIPRSPQNASTSPRVLGGSTGDTGNGPPKPQRPFQRNLRGYAVKPQVSHGMPMFPGNLHRPLLKRQSSLLESIRLPQQTEVAHRNPQGYLEGKFSQEA